MKWQIQIANLFLSIKHLMNMKFHTLCNFWTVYRLPLCWILLVLINYWSVSDRICSSKYMQPLPHSSIQDTHTIVVLYYQNSFQKANFLLLLKAFESLCYFSNRHLNFLTWFIQLTRNFVPSSMFYDIEWRGFLELKMTWQSFRYGKCLS